MSELAIVIPAYNEEKRIEKTLKAYLLYFRKLPKKNLKNFKIIVVLNNCSDGTEKIVKKNICKNIEMLNFKKGGKGFAVIEGFKHALRGNYTHIGFVDADMSTSPEEYYRLYSKIENNDGVIASRYLKGAKLSPANTLPRILASRVYNSLIRATIQIPYRDTQCGAKIFRRETIYQIINKMGMTSWAFDIEMLYLMNKNKFKIIEVPTIWSNRDYSKINFWKSGPWMAMSVLRFRLINSPLKKMIRIYDKFIRFFKPSM